MSEMVKQAVILAGGRGERLKPFTDSAPKPMYPVGGIPFIDRLLQQVKSFGIEEVLLLLGYRAEQIMEEVGDGRKFGLRVTYDVTPPEYETADRMKHAGDQIQDVFLLMYCDNYCPVDFPALCRDFERNRALVQLSAYANRDGYTRDNLAVEDGRVTVYDGSRKTPGLSGVDIGYTLVDKRCFAMLGNTSKFADLYAEMARLGRLYATVTEHRYYSIGSFARMPLTEEFFREKRVVFLDRDGTLNRRPPRACYVERPEDFIWLPGAVEAVRKLKEKGCLTILISNQPGIARGNLTVETLDRIHEKMQKDLEKAGARIDHIYYCPHNWDEGCDCRKPRPGMLYRAQKDLSLDLTRCVLFGDDERDMEAGNAAGCRSVLLTEEYSLLDAVEDYIKGWPDK